LASVKTVPGKDPAKAASQRLFRLLRKPGRLSWPQVGLFGLIALTGWLYLFRLEELGYSNEYYASAVKSMLGSWSNFFMAAFDPAGFITVDKPPVFLWVQAVFAWFLGFSGLSLLIPQALAGMLSVVLLYHLVGRVFGPAAGLLAGLSLGLTPIFVIISRHNNPESLLILVMLGMAWALTKAVEGGRLPWILAFAGLAGVAFNLKMLQAFVVLPAFYLVYLLMGPSYWLKRVTHLALATLLLFIISLAWALLVDNVPAGQRPFIGGSTNNTVLNLILGYNGLGRVEGSEGSPGSGGSFSIVSLAGQAGPLRLFMDYVAGEVNWLAPLVLAGLLVLARQHFKGFKLAKIKTPALAALLVWTGWLVSFGLVFSFSRGTIHSYYLVMLAPPLAALFGAGLVALWQTYRRESGNWSGWVLPVALLVNATYQVYILQAYPVWNARFSPLVLVASLVGVACLVAGRLWHTRPALKLLSSRVGIGLAFSQQLLLPAAWSINQLYITPFNPTLPSARPGMETATGTLGNRYIWENPAQPAWSGLVTVILPLGLIMAVALLALLKFSARFDRPNIRRGIRLAGLVVLVVCGLLGFAANQAWSTGRGAAATAAANPVSRPDPKLIQYLQANNPAQAFLAAVTNTTLAAPLILETGQPVLAIGGYMGIDPALSPEQARNMVKEGRLRFFLVSQNNGFGNVSSEAGTGAIFNWASRDCQQIDPALWQSFAPNASPAHTSLHEQLFDCRAP
jgi:4-amino-4-deoxy-L-arabinose transferase-like glycosyltransferase